MSPRPWLPVLIMLATTLVSCRFEDRTPGGSKPEDAAMRAAVTDLYLALGAKDAAKLTKVVLPAGTALLARPDGAVLVSTRTMIDVPERRNEGGGVHIARMYIRPDGAVATARVVVVSTNPTDRREYESTDFLTLANREGAWYVAQAVFGLWRIRSAP